MDEWVVQGPNLGAAKGTFVMEPRAVEEVGK
jgi:hypothetical protein